MGWVVKIGEGATEFQITASAKFNFTMQTSYNENGTAQFKEITIEVEGDVVASTPATVADDTITFTNEVLTKLGPKRVRLDLDAVTKFDFKPEESIGSPVVTIFRTVDEDGNADSHWRYGMQIFVKQPGNALENLIELFTSILVVTKNGKVVRKVWRANAKALTIQSALSAVLTFKPAEKFIQEEIERFFQENRVVAAWIWEGQRDKTKGEIEIVEEPIQITNRGGDFTFDTQIGDPKKQPIPSILHRAPDRITQVVVRGVVRGFTNDLKPPPEHFKASPGKIVRWSAAETTSLVTIEDPIAGTFRLPYNEVWLFTERVTPVPNHSGHDKIKIDQEPADGRISAS